MSCSIHQVLSSAVVILVVISQGSQVAGVSSLVSFGGCPDVPSMDNFNVTQYTGTWYEYSKFSNWFQRNLKCVRAVYGLNGDGSVSVENSGIDTGDGDAVSIQGTATIPDPTKPAELKVSFSPLDFSRRANYFVVNTDYTNYAVVYSCSKIPILPINLQFAWILTRQRGVAPTNLNDLEAELRGYGVNPDMLRVTDQTGC